MTIDPSIVIDNKSVVLVLLLFLFVHVYVRLLLQSAVTFRVYSNQIPFDFVWCFCSSYPKSIMGKYPAYIGIRASGEGCDSTGQNNPMADRFRHWNSNLRLGSSRRFPVKSNSKVTYDHSNIMKGVASLKVTGKPMKKKGIRNSKYHVNHDMRVASSSSQWARGPTRNRVRGDEKKNAADAMKWFTNEKGFRCFVCHEFGHKAMNCSSKTSHLSSLDVLKQRDYLVKGTELGNWNKIWFLDHGFKNHITGDKDVFIRFKDCYRILTKTNKHGMLFVRGIGEIEIFVNGKFQVIPSVYYVPNMKKNVLSANQLASQGFDFSFNGDACFIK